MAVYAIGVSEDLTESEAGIALEYVRSESNHHDLVVIFDDFEVKEINKASTALSLISRPLFSREKASVFFDWSRRECDAAERTVLITTGALVLKGKTNCPPFCSSMLALVPRKGRVMWTIAEAERYFFHDQKEGKYFQRIVILDHEGFVADTLDNPRICVSARCSGFWLPSPEDDLFQVPIDVSR